MRSEIGTVAAVEDLQNSEPSPVACHERCGQDAVGDEPGLGVDLRVEAWVVVRPIDPQGFASCENMAGNTAACRDTNFAHVHAFSDQRPQFTLRGVVKKKR